MTSKSSWIQLFLKDESIKSKCEWPPLFDCGQPTVPQSDETAKSCIHLNGVVNNFERLSLQESSAIVVPLTREKIKAARVVRNHAAREEKKRLRYLKQLSEIRAPKSQQVRVIDVLPVPTSRLGQEQPKKPYRNQIPLIVDLASVVKTKTSQRKAKSQIHPKRSVNTLSISQKIGGKRREFPRKKSLSKLKRNILTLRLSRREKESKHTESTESTTELPLAPSVTCTPVPEDRQQEHIVESLLSTDSISPNRSEAVTTVFQSETCRSATVQHSRKFRPYCNNVVTPELNKSTDTLIERLFAFQKRAFEKNEIKARAHKRFVVGIKESMRQLELKKLKLLLIAPDMEPNLGVGGIDETIENIKKLATSNETTFYFGSKRRRIGYLLHKKVPVCCVGIIDYSGAEDTVQELLREIKIAQDLYISQSS